MAKIKIYCYYHVLFFKDTFERAQQWITELRRQARPDILIALAANKTDLLMDNDSSTTGSSSITSTTTTPPTPILREPAIPREVMSAYARDHHLLLYETSAKTGSNVHEMFSDIARNLLQRLPESSAKTTPETERRFFTGSSGGGGLVLTKEDRQRTKSTRRSPSKSCAC